MGARWPHHGEMIPETHRVRLRDLTDPLFANKKQKLE